MQPVRIHRSKERNGSAVCVHPEIPGMCQGSVQQASSCAPACPVPAAKVSTGVLGAEGSAQFCRFISK